MESVRYFAAALSILSAIIIHATYAWKWRPNGFLGSLWAAASLSSLLCAWLITGQTNSVLALGALLCVTGLVVNRLLPVVTPAGHGLLYNAIGIALAMATWTYEVTIGLGLPAWLENAALVAQTLVFLYSFVVSVPSQLCSLGEFSLTQDKRDNMYRTIEARRGKSAPRVCVQVACYAEPPAMVIATLNAIANLRYENFEVIVIDNNTKDPTLWRPVQTHCRQLGERFRFVHVDSLPGAKAGALNYVSKQVGTDAEVIAIVDADYIVEPDFLERWTPVFEDPKIGFVQTTHEYRDWEESGFLSRFYPGYVSAHKLMFPSLTAFNAEFTVGTMCMVRRSALEEVGGWAEWCQTEDSELAVRLHAKGYRGFYFTDASGRGLIPDTLDAMRKQRFRWSYGPIQQLKKHWRLYFGLSNKTGSLSFMQRYFEIAHSLEHTPAMLGIVITAPLWCAVYQEVFQGAQSVVGIDFIVFMLATVAKRRWAVWVNLLQIGRGTLADFLINPAATTTIKVYEMKGALCAALNLKWPWVRTDKFPATGSLRRAAAISRVDMTILACSLLTMVLLRPVASFWPLNFSGMMFVVSSLGASVFLISIGLCYLREFELLGWTGPARRVGTLASASR